MFALETTYCNSGGLCVEIYCTAVNKTSRGLNSVTFSMVHLLLLKSFDSSSQLRSPWPAVLL